MAVQTSGVTNTLAYKRRCIAEQSKESYHAAADYYAPIERYYYYYLYKYWKNN